MQALQLTYDGIVIGSLYALVGLGVVIVFRTTNVLNFAHAAVATTAGYAAWALIAREGLPYPVAATAAIVLGALIGLAIGALLTFVLHRTTPLEKSVATLGVTLAVGWADRTLFTDQTQAIPRVFNVQIHLGELVLGGHGLYVVAVAAVALAATFVLLERTRLGLAMRSLSQDETTARMYGVSASTVTLAAWSIASALGALSGVLTGSFIQIDHSIMTTILIQSFAALVLGGFGSASGAVVGGLLLGVSSSLVAGFFSLAYKNTFVFAIILLVLIVRPHGLVGKPAISVAEGGTTSRAPTLPAPGSWRRPRWLVGVGLAIAALVALPWLPHPFPLVTYSVLLSTAIVVVSLSLFMGYVGEFSLGHGALVTVGAYVAAILTRELAGLPFVVAVGAAVLAAGLIGTLLGWVTLRLSGVYLAIATLALTFVVTEVVLQLRTVTGGAVGTPIAAPVLIVDPITTDLGIYLLVVGSFVLVALVAAALLRSSFGRYWVAIRDGPVAAAAMGVAVRRHKVTAFAVSSAIAGLGGALLGTVITHVGPFDFGLQWSITLILAVIVGGSGSIAGAVFGAAFAVLVPAALSRTAGLSDLVFGIALIAVFVVAPGGLQAVASNVNTWVRMRRLAGRAPQPGASADAVG